MPKQSSLILDSNTDSAAQAVCEEHGLSLSDLVRTELARGPLFTEIAPYVPGNTRRKVALNETQWRQVEKLAEESGLHKADILRALIARSAARYQQNRLTGGVPPGG